MSDWSVGDAAKLLGLASASTSDVDRRTADLERALGRPIPRAVQSLLAYDGLVDALARTYTSQPRLLTPSLLDSEQLPGVDGDVLWLMTENQGVCVWGVPLDVGDDPPVLVGGDLLDRDSPAPYAESIGTFVYAWAWDAILLGSEPLIQAQAAELDAATENFVASRLVSGPTTWGWPCARNLRFEGPGVRTALWACGGQCDWWISGSDGRTVERWVRELLPYSNLASSLWSNDEAGMALLERVRSSA